MAEEKVKWYRSMWDAAGGKKFLALLITTGLMLVGKLTAEAYMWIVIAYMGANSVVHLAGALGKATVTGDDGNGGEK